MTHGRYAIIPTHNRPEMLAELVAIVSREVDAVFVIDNASDQPVSTRALREACEYPRGEIVVLRDDEQPPNLSRLWNIGLDAVDEEGSDANRPEMVTWDIAVLNDDALPPTGWLTAVSNAMRSDERKPAAACMLPLYELVLKTEPDRELHRRLDGGAFMLRGELGLRADERMRWWWGDTDLDWQARAAGGTLLVPGPPVPNRLANSTTVGELALQGGRDGEVFKEKWGYRPWL
jgi:GT2 family glycosyltransferase